MNLQATPPPLDLNEKAIARATFPGLSQLIQYLQNLLKLIPPQWGQIVAQQNPEDATLLTLVAVRIYITATRPFVNFNRLLNSDAYWYPIKGIQYFYHNPKLWYSLQVIPPHFAISFIIYSVVWSIFFPAQFVIATVFGGPIGIIVAAISTIQQCHYYSSFVTNRVLLPEQLDAIFDSVMISEVQYNVVLYGKLRRITPTPAVTKFRRMMWAIPTELIFYPLSVLQIVVPTIYNSVPLLGPLILAMNNASKIGIEYQSRYFKLKNLKPNDIAMLNKKRMGHYASFGFIAAMLEALPVFGFIFKISNTIGAAIWCRELEKQMECEATDRINTIRGLIRVLP